MNPSAQQIQDQMDHIAKIEALHAEMYANAHAAMAQSHFVVQVFGCALIAFVIIGAVVILKPIFTKE